MELHLPVVGSYTSTVEVLRPLLSNPPITYILLSNTAPTISDLAVGTGVPVVQYDSVDGEGSEEKIIWEMEDGNTITATNRIPVVIINFKLYSDKQHSNQFLVFS